jgi:stage III sporulation protein AF
MALVTGLCRSLMPEGASRRVGGLVCGLLLFTVLVAPVKGVRLEGLGDALTDWAGQYEGYSSAMEETDRSLERSLVEAQCGAYLEDRARELGCTCTAAVECEEREGLSVPAEVTFSGELTQEQRETLRSLAVTELALEPGQVHFGGGRSP